jgi:hypothetical protein
VCIPARGAHTVSEARQIDEAVLAAIWNEQAPLRGPMWDCEGNPVAVVYRGRWTAGSGPDFEGAMLSLGASDLVTGSVEMHLQCADWWAHNHHTDPRYNSVVLHVVLWPQGARPVVRQDGVSVPTLVLADYITLPAAELLEKVQPLIPNLGALSEEPCWQRTQDWPLEEILGRIEAAGDERLLSKAAIMEADLDVYGSTDEVFYRGLMDALGYSANREPMRTLASALPLSQLLTLPLEEDASERAMLLESILLGAGGFLPSQRSDLEVLDWLSTEHAGELEALWRSYAPFLGLAPEKGLVTGWRVERVRPANSPVRRLAAGAYLLARLLWEQGGMLGPFVSRLDLPPEQLARRWTALLSVTGTGYWASYADFGHPLSADKEEMALIGTSRAADIVVNVLLPLIAAYAIKTETSGLQETALSVYALYPKLADNHITRAMTEEAIGPRGKGAINGARRQQGLIHLYKLYCQARRCYECPISGIRG